MSDQQLPIGDPSAAAHPSPTPYTPLSGLAITAFVLSIVLGLIALMGVWVSEIAPLLLGVLAIYTIRSNKKRGRLLAIFAIFIAFAFGSCSYMMHSAAMDAFGKVPESILVAITAKKDDQARDEELRKWAWPAALEKDAELTAGWRENYAKAAETYGEWNGELDLSVPWYGSTVLFIPPEGVELVAGEGDKPAPGGAIWVRATFAKGPLWVAVLLGEGDSEGLQALREGYEPDKTVAVISDVRFYKGS